MTERTQASFTNLNSHQINKNYLGHVTYDKSSTYPALLVLSGQSPIVKGNHVAPTSYQALTQTALYGPKVHKWNKAKRVVTGFAPQPIHNLTVPYVGWKQRNYTSAPNLKVPSSSDSDNAVLKALDKAAGINFDAAMALAEARETASTLTSLTSTLVQSVMAVKKLDIKKLRKILIKSKSTITGKGNNKLSRRQFNQLVKRKTNKGLNSAADAWLQYRYGIMPIIYDIEAVGEYLSDKITNDDFTQTVVGGHDLKIDESINSSINKVSHTGKVTSLCSLTFQIKSPSYRTLQEFGFTSPYALAWELVPFSFVIDWALPVGSFLRALTTIPGIDFKYGYMGYIYEIDSWEDFEIKPNSVGDMQIWSRGIKSKGYRRVPFYHIPFPFPRFQNPIRGIGDLDRVMDLASLFKQFTK